MAIGPKTVVVGTRGSALAIAQTGLIVSLLRRRCPALEFTVQVVETTGDRVQDRPISQIGDKGVFVRAIEEALLRGEIDLAVHSLKDVPADLVVPDLELVAFAERADPRDVLISAMGSRMEELPDGAAIGTSSARRRVQLQNIRPSLRSVEIRGNVDTRLHKLDTGAYDGIMLAAAGLIRLGLHHRITQYLSPSLFVPDAGQGILVLQARCGDGAAQVGATADDAPSRVAATAERAAVRALGADCHSPVGAYALMNSNRISLIGMAATGDGRIMRRAEAEGAVSDGERLGRDLGERLRRLIEE